MFFMKNAILQRIGVHLARQAHFERAISAGIAQSLNCLEMVLIAPGQQGFLTQHRQSLGPG
jgi:hypothetical protein